MRVSRRILFGSFFFAASLTACTALLGGFDVSSASADAGPDGAGGGDDSSTTGEGGPGDQDGGVDADVDCGVGSMLTGCGGSCVDLASSSDHCGICARSCGGSQCNAGKCDPVLLYDNTDAGGGGNVGRVAVAPLDVFFAVNDDGSGNSRLLACAKAGCTVAPRQIVSMEYSIEGLALPSTLTVAFQSAPTQTTERPALFYCPVAGCPGGTPPSCAMDGLGGFDLPMPVNVNRLFFSTEDQGLGFSDCTANGASCTTAQYFTPTLRGTRGLSADGTSFYFIDSLSRGQGITKCPVADAGDPCTPTVLVPGGGDAAISDITLTALDNGILYWVKTGRSGFIEGKIFSCDLSAACPATPPTLVNGLDSPTEMVADLSGVYWITAGPPAKIQKCALPSCTGGAKDITGALDSPHSLVTDDAFIYYAESQKVWRIAK